jgi:hypothetical protein
MGADGVLTSSGAARTEPTRPSNGGYRYQDENNRKEPVNDDIQRQIEEEKLRQKDAEQRIRDLEKQKRDAQQPGTGVTPESIDDKEDGIAISSPSPVFSLMKTFF